MIKALSIQNVPSKLFGKKKKNFDAATKEVDTEGRKNTLNLKTTVESIDSILQGALQAKIANSVTEDDDDSSSESENLEVEKMSKSEAISMIKVAIQGLEKEQHQIQTMISKNIDFAKHRIKGEDKTSSSIANDVVASCAMKKAKVLEAKQIQIAKVRSALKELKLNVKNDVIPPLFIEREMDVIIASKNDFEKSVHNLSRKKLIRAAKQA